jgi:hypothetical protein
MEMGAPTSMYAGYGYNAIREVLEIWNGHVSSLARGSEPSSHIEAGNFLTSWAID